MVFEADEAGTSRGRMTAYAFFVQVVNRIGSVKGISFFWHCALDQTCRDEHKRQHPEEFVHFQEFSRKCASRWKTMTER